jgi:hypothetical protein
MSPPSDFPLSFSLSFLSILSSPDNSKFGVEAMMPLSPLAGRMGYDDEDDEEEDEEEEKEEQNNEEEDDEEEGEEEEEEGEEEEEDHNKNNIKQGNVDGVLVNSKYNPCACLQKNKCLFIKFVNKSNLVLSNSEDLQKARKLLDSRCINDNCKKLIYSFCLPTKKLANGPTKRMRTRCSSCHVNDSADSTNKIFSFISENQE